MAENRVFLKWGGEATKGIAGEKHFPRGKGECKVNFTTKKTVTVMTNRESEIFPSRFLGIVIFSLLFYGVFL